jgi:hypothetical protein
MTEEYLYEIIGTFTWVKNVTFRKTCLVVDSFGSIITHTHTQGCTDTLTMNELLYTLTPIEM